MFSQRHGWGAVWCAVRSTVISEGHGSRCGAVLLVWKSHGAVRAVHMVAELPRCGWGDIVYENRTTSFSFLGFVFSMQKKRSNPSRNFT